MLINAMPPPLPVGFNGTAALCPTRSGLMGDPFGITDVLGIVSNWISARRQEKIQDKQIGIERAALKHQTAVDAGNFAAQQAAALVAPSTKQRQDQMIALIAIGGAAVIVAGLFIYGAVRKS